VVISSRRAETAARTSPRREEITTGDTFGTQDAPGQRRTISTDQSVGERKPQLTGDVGERPA
jgi:hypothetical protein